MAVNLQALEEVCTALFLPLVFSKRRKGENVEGVGGGLHLGNVAPQI